MLKVNRKETKAVIDDTLSRIRAIEGITVVNSETNERASDLTHVAANVEFKFIPPRDTRQVVKNQVEQFKAAMKREPYVDSVVILWSTLVKVS